MLVTRVSRRLLLFPTGQAQQKPNDKTFAGTEDVDILLQSSHAFLVDIPASALGLTFKDHFMDIVARTLLNGLTDSV